MAHPNTEEPEKPEALLVPQRDTEEPEQPTPMLEEVEKLETEREIFKRETKRFSDKLLYGELKDKRIKLDKVKCAKLALTESQSLLRQISNQEELFGDSLKFFVESTSTLVGAFDTIPDELSESEVKIKKMLRFLEK